MDLRTQILEQLYKNGNGRDVDLAPFLREAYPNDSKLILSSLMVLKGEKKIEQTWNQSDDWKYLDNPHRGKTIHNVTAWFHLKEAGRKEYLEYCAYMNPPKPTPQIQGESVIIIQGDNSGDVTQASGSSFAKKEITTINAKTDTKPISNQSLVVRCWEYVSNNKALSLLVSTAILSVVTFIWKYLKAHRLIQ